MKKNKLYINVCGLIKEEITSEVCIYHNKVYRYVQTQINKLDF